LSGAVVIAAGVLVALAASAFELSAPRVAGGGAVADRDALATHAPSARLPLAAEDPVSQILGRDDPAYRVVGDRAGVELRNPKQRLGAWFDRRAAVIRASGFATRSEPFGWIGDVWPVGLGSGAARGGHRDSCSGRGEPSFGSRCP
jgi:hypothetical protein